MDENKDSLSNLIEQRDVTEKELKALEIKFSRQRFQKASATERIQSISDELETLDKEKNLIASDRQTKYERRQKLSNVITDLTKTIENVSVEKIQKGSRSLKQRECLMRLKKKNEK